MNHESRPGQHICRRRGVRLLLAFTATLWVGTCGVLARVDGHLLCVVGVLSASLLSRLGILVATGVSCRRAVTRTLAAMLGDIAVLALSARLRDALLAVDSSGDWVLRIHSTYYITYGILTLGLVSVFALALLSVRSSGSARVRCVLCYAVLTTALTAAATRWSFVSSWSIVQTD